MAPTIAVLYNPDPANEELGPIIEVEGTRVALRTEVGAVAAACRENGWEPFVVEAGHDPMRLVDDLVRRRAAAVFNLAEGVGPETRLEPAVAWLLEWLGIPYTGSPPAALQLALIKPVTRAWLAANGIAVPRGYVVEHADEPLPEIAYPAIVKPSREDGSEGITRASVVEHESAARVRIRDLLERFRQPALVEEFVDGRELTVALLGPTEKPEVLPVREIDYSTVGHPLARILTFDAKWSPEALDYRSTPAIFAELDQTLERRVVELACAAWRALGMRDYGRVDFRVSAVDGPLVIDVNPNPDISPDAGLAETAAHQGITYAELIGRTVEAALSRGPSGALAG